ncbi:hypothetical protein [Streptomyces sp. BK208]|uniref:hypothetical protein n=1 Tax=Streptomyces sp. BK208 TaxID=2512150 RepID=UPI00105ED34F|nr:hypothetical protein [Streptomyces sp. BK208]
MVATLRPQNRRNWDGVCHREGGACWAQEQAPCLCAVGPAAAVAMAAALVALFWRYGPRE